MAKQHVIVDSCVFIQAFRNNVQAKKDLKKVEDKTCFSIITELELLAGANTLVKKEAVKRIFESFYGIPVTEEISAKAIELMQEYVSGQQHFSVPDCLIAATAIISGFPLLTYNRKDFAFIKGLQLYT